MTLPSARIARRRLVQTSAGAAAGIAAVAGSGLPILAAAQATPAASPVADVADLPRSGDAVPELQGLEDTFVAAITKWGIPGGQMAIARDGKLVYSRGFGYADVEAKEAVERTHRFRIASCSKPFTGVGILKLVDDGLLTLDTPVFPLLAFDGPSNAPYDKRLDAITVEHLLVHAGGWDSAGTGFDPQYLPWPALASHVLGEADPASGETIVRWMLSQPLNFDPGTKSSYSNFGFNVLGRVIEHVSGQPYEVWMQEQILAPAGITSMAIGGTLLADRMPDEVRYYGSPDAKTQENVYPNEGFAPLAYGSYYLRAMDAHGGYISTADDLVRFMLAIDGARGTALLTPETVKVMDTTERPPELGAGAGNTSAKTGLAWNTAVNGPGYSWDHAGALEGSTASWTYRTGDGTAIAWVINMLPSDLYTFLGESIGSMRTAVPTITSWPSGDLFAE